MTTLLIKNGNLIDGTGKDAQSAASILVEHGKIKDIRFGTVSDVGDDVLQIDAEGKYIMPGLIDCHVHYGGAFDPSDKEWVLENDIEQAIRSVAQCQQSLRHGFTSVRDISKNGIYLRNTINNNHIIGPRIIACGRGLSRRGGHADSYYFPVEFVNAHHPWGIVADGVEDVRKAVRAVLREGADFIKVWASGGGLHAWERETDTHFTFEEIEIMVEEAEMYGVPVAAHCENADSVEKCIRAGVKSIEHGEEFTDACYEALKARKQKDPAYDITVVPTIGLFVEWYKEYDPPTKRNLTGCEGNTLGEKELFRIRKNFEKMIENGLRIAVGADSFCSSLTPYGMYTYNEMYALKDNGLPDKDVLVAATKNGAELLGIDDVTGTLEVGKDADIIILDEDPAADIRNINMRNLNYVIKQGEVVDFNRISYTDEKIVKELLREKSVKK